MKYTFDESEEFVLRHGDVAIPIELTENDAVIYHAVEDIFLAWDAELSGGPLTEQAKRSLISALCGVMNAFGFVPSEDVGTALLTYHYISDENHGAKANGTVILQTPEDIAKYEFDTSLWRLDIDPDDEFDVLCCRVENGRVAAFAAVNDFSDEDYPEICVECAPEHRCKGYATECAEGLVKYLTGVCGAKAVSYVCRESNIASRRVAEKAGFKFVSRRVPFVFYRDSEK